MGKNARTKSRQARAASFEATELGKELSNFLAIAEKSANGCLHTKTNVTTDTTVSSFDQSLTNGTSNTLHIAAEALLLRSASEFATQIVDGDVYARAVRARDLLIRLRVVQIIHNDDCFTYIGNQLIDNTVPAGQRGTRIKASFASSLDGVRTQKYLIFHRINPSDQTPYIRLIDIFRPDEQAVESGKILSAAVDTVDMKELLGFGEDREAHAAYREQRDWYDAEISTQETLGLTHADASDLKELNAQIAARFPSVI